MTDKTHLVAEKPKAADVPLANLILDCPRIKYRLVSLATRWAHEVKKRDQDSQPLQVIMQKALKELLTGEVDTEMVEKLPPLPRAEKKQLESPQALAEKFLNMPPDPPTDDIEEKEAKE